MTVIIANDLKKESVRLDKNGNVIDPRTKEIIERNEVVQPTQPPVQIQETSFIKPHMTLKEIKQAIKTLEEMKEKKVAELKAELEDL